MISVIAGIILLIILLLFLYSACKISGEIAREEELEELEKLKDKFKES